MNTLENVQFVGVEKLLKLDLSSNSISDLKNVTLKGIDYLDTLDLSENNFNSIENFNIQGLPNLKVLLLESCKIISSKLTFLGLESLRILNLDSNLFKPSSPIFINGVENLEALSLQSNRNLLVYKSLSIIGFKRLKQLDLSFKLLYSLDSWTFSGLDHLIELKLQNNYITSLSDIRIDGLKNLKTLDLSYNSVTSLDFSIQGIEKLDKLVLKCNPIYKLDFKPNVFNIELYLYAKLQSNANYFGCKQTLVTSTARITYWYLKDINITSLNENLSYFYRKSIRFSSNRTMNFYQSLPILPFDELNGSSRSSWNASYFFSLFRLSKVIRLLLGSHREFEDFISQIYQEELES